MKNRKYECCEKRFAQKGLLTHENDKHRKYNCITCLTKFDDHEESLKHDQNKHGKYYCNICFDQFKDKTSRDQHKSDLKRRKDHKKIKSSRKKSSQECDNCTNKGIRRTCKSCKTRFCHFCTLHYLSMDYNMCLECCDKFGIEIAICALCKEAIATKCCRLCDYDFCDSCGDENLNLDTCQECLANGSFPARLPNDNELKRAEQYFLEELVTDEGFWMSYEKLMDERKNIYNLYISHRTCEICNRLGTSKILSTRSVIINLNLRDDEFYTFMDMIYYQHGIFVKCCNKGSLLPGDYFNEEFDKLEII